MSDETMVWGESEKTDGTKEKLHTTSQVTGALIEQPLQPTVCVPSENQISAPHSCKSSLKNVTFNRIISHPTLGDHT